MKIYSVDKKNLTKYVSALKEQVEDYYDVIMGLEKQKRRDGKFRKGAKERYNKMKYNCTLLKVVIEDLEEVNIKMSS